MLCFADATGEALAALLRPGNATSNGVADHLTVLDAALAQLPAGIAVGHRVGDDRAAVGRAVMVRTDSAGGSHGYVRGCRERNVGFAVVARKTSSIQAAISAVQDHEGGWVTAVDQHGDELAGSSVPELTDWLDLSAWPQGTRNLEFRFWGHYTDQAGDPASLDLTCGAHAHVEEHIGRLKDSELLRFPFVDQDANRAWFALVCFAADLVRWSAAVPQR